MHPPISKSILIQASPAAVWEALTIPELMQQWMGEPEMKLEIIGSWKVGEPILIRGYHHGKFENKGVVLALEPTKLFRYNYLSSVSRLPDIHQNYTTVEFKLEPIEADTQLSLTLRNFPTESIFKHVDFYWTGTLGILKRFVELNKA